MIRQLREEREMSQRQLAKEALIHRSTLRRIEEDRVDVKSSVLERLANVLGYDMDLISRSTFASQNRRPSP